MIHNAREWKAKPLSAGTPLSPPCWCALTIATLFVLVLQKSALRKYCLRMGSVCKNCEKLANSMFLCGAR